MQTISISYRVVPGHVNMGRARVQSVDVGHSDYAVAADLDEWTIRRDRNEVGRIVEETWQMKWDRYFDERQRAYYCHCTITSKSRWTAPPSGTWCEYY